MTKLKSRKVILKEALAKGYDINTLYAHKDLLIELLTPGIFLRHVLCAYIRQYNPNIEEFIIDPEKLVLQKNLIRESLQQGANINNLRNIDIEVLDALKEFLLHHVPEDFLRLVVRANVKQWNSKTEEPVVDDAKAQLQIDLIELTISAGINVNSGVGRPSLLSQAKTVKVAKLLKAHGAHLYAEEKERMKEYFEVFKSGPNILTQKYQYLTIPPSEINRIPYTIHHIWLTHSSSPKEILDADIQNVIHTSQIYGSKFEIIVWVNDKSFIPKSIAKLNAINKKLEVEVIKHANATAQSLCEFGSDINLLDDLTEETAMEAAKITVKSIYGDAPGIRSLDVVAILIDKKLWGMASDLLRYSIIENEGGLYADLNYKMSRSLESEFHKFDLFSKTYGDNHCDVENSFFAAKPMHQKFSCAVDRTNKQLISNGVLSGDMSHTEATKLTSPTTGNAVAMCYYAVGDSGGTIDAVFPATCFDERKKVRKFGQEKILVITEVYGEQMASEMQYLDDNDICFSSELEFGRDLAGARTWEAE
jgi:hypothetical protein